MNHHAPCQRQRLARQTYPPLNWAGGPTSTLHCVLLTQGTFFENVGVMLGRAVLEAPEPFCEVLDPLIGGRS